MDETKRAGIRAVELQVQMAKILAAQTVETPDGPAYGVGLWYGRENGIDRDADPLGAEGFARWREEARSLLRDTAAAFGVEVPDEVMDLMP